MLRAALAKHPYAEWMHSTARHYSSAFEFVLWIALAREPLGQGAAAGIGCTDKEHAHHDIVKRNAAPGEQLQCVAPYFGWGARVANSR